MNDRIREEKNRDIALEKRGKDTTKLHLIVDMMRIGAQLFAVKLEYGHFGPRTGRNYLFEMAIMTWPKDIKMMFAIMSFPIEYKEIAENIAKECGLRIADGVPTLITHEGPQFFPMDGPTVFTLENSIGHEVYKNDPKRYEQLKLEEQAAADVIIKADQNALFKEMKDKGYTQTQCERILAKWQSGDETYDEVPENKDAMPDAPVRHQGFL